jgi:Dolichyl-phosphate-mannose-protein mannosyltransferase
MECVERRVRALATDRLRARNPLQSRAERVEMRQAASATIEPSTRAEPTHREFSRPVQIFAAIFVLAAIVYSFHLGTDALGASEAFSAWSAAKPGIAAIANTPLLHEPGKFLFYYSALHYYARIFGMSEISLRSMSVLFSLITLALVFALGREMFDEGTALAAAAMWAFNPYAVVFAHTARMYPMLIALALGHLLTLLIVRARPNIAIAVVSAILGAAMLYAHMAGAAIVGAEAAILIRDLARGRRDTIAWMVLILAGVLFVPYIPYAIRQSQQMIYGQWLDYLGPPYHFPLAIKVAALILATSVTCWIVLGRSREQDRDEPIRLLIAWIVLPTMAFIVGSVLLHPMTNPRYLSPAIAASTLLIAGSVGAWSVKWRNLVAAGFVVACLILLPFARSRPQPWREFAAQVAASGASDPVFFESGFVSNESTVNVPNGGFPFGFYSIVFNYYFKGTNPRIVIPGYDPHAAQLTITENLSAARGGWLVSWKDRHEVKSELPDSSRFQVVETYEQPHLAIYRITPASPK